MPFYEYRCASCDARFELRRPSEHASMPAECPSCGGPGRRLISMFTSSFGTRRRLDPLPTPSGGGGSGGGCCGGSCGCGN